MLENAGYAWIGLALVLVQLLLGIAVAWLCKQSYAGSQVWNEERAKQFCARMQELAQELAGNVGNHTLEIQTLNRELEESAKQGVIPPEGVILATVAQIVTANRGLEAKLAAIEERIQEQANKIDQQMVEARVDGLTRLANRRAFDDEFARRFAEYERTGATFCLLLADIDHFKQFNDRFGHDAGDHVLQQVARRLSSTMRDVDLVARHGGEEFAVVVVAASLAESFRAAERSRVFIGQQAYSYEGHELHVTASVGLAEVLAGDTAVSLFKRADAALYAAKQNGRNCGYYHDGQRLCPLVGAARAASVPVNEPLSQESAPQPRSALPASVPSVRAAGKPASVLRRSFTDALRLQMAQARATKQDLSILLVGNQHGNEQAESLRKDQHDATFERMAEVVTRSVRLGDLVTRYGWNQFAVILPNSNLMEAARIEARVRAALDEAEMGTPDEEPLVVCSGLAEMCVDDDLVSLARRASSVLEQARAAVSVETLELVSRAAGGESPAAVGAAS